MNILVTGASGFLGLEIAKELKSLGHQVFNFSRTHTKELEDSKIKTLKGDLTSYEDVTKAVSKVDAIFHVAGKVAMWGKWDDFYQINVIGAQNIVRAAKENNIKKIVFTSSPSVVFGKEEIVNGNETAPYPKQYISMYAKSKAMAEKVILDANGQDLHTCSLRPHLIFGPRDKNIIPRLVEARRRNKLKIIGNGENLVDVIHVKNAVSAHIKAFDKLQDGSPVCGQAYFIGQEKPVKLWDFINQILKVKGEAPVEKKISLGLAYSIGYIIEIFLKLFRVHNIHPPMTRFVSLQLGTSHYFSHDKAKKDFDYSPVINLKDALETLN